MNCCNDYGQCTRGEHCCARKPQELHVTMEDNPFDMDWMLETVRDLFAIIGFVAMVILIGLFFGYLS
jgi:hypothetical protein